MNVFLLGFPVKILLTLVPGRPALPLLPSSMDALVPKHPPGQRHRRGVRVDERQATGDKTEKPDAEAQARGPQGGSGPEVAGDR